MKTARLKIIATLMALCFGAIACGGRYTKQYDTFSHQKKFHKEDEAKVAKLSFDKVEMTENRHLDVRVEATNRIPEYKADVYKNITETGYGPNLCLGTLGIIYSPLLLVIDILTPGWTLMKALGGELFGTSEETETGRIAKNELPTGEYQEKIWPISDGSLQVTVNDSIHETYPNFEGQIFIPLEEIVITQFSSLPETLKVDLIAMRDGVTAKKTLTLPAIELNGKNKEGETPLMRAIKYGRHGLVQALLDKNADVDLKDNDGMTALMYAVTNDQDYLMNMLLDKKTDLNAQNKKGNTVLMIASIKGNTEFTRTLLDNEAEVNTKDENGWTALMIAAKRGHLLILRALLANGAKVNLKNNGGQTALVISVSHDNAGIVETLLDKGANINAMGNNGKTPLMVVANKGNLSTVQTLIDNGVEVNIENKYGMTALLMAENQGHSEIAQSLKEAKVKQKNQSKKNYAPPSQKTKQKDTTPPEIIITSHQTRGISIIEKKQLTTITGIAKDDSKIANLTVNSSKVRADENGVFRTDIGLVPGTNRIIVSAIDIFGNKSHKTFTIIRADSAEDIAKYELEKTRDDITGKYYALVIGNNNYKHLPKLQTAKNDAREIGKILSQKFGFKTKLLYNATRNDISRALNNHTKILRENDNFLIYYAGHGIFDETGKKAYWLPVDALRDDDTEWIIVDSITTKIRRIASKHILIVADSCYSGTMTRGLSVNVGSNRYLQRMLKKSSRTLLASGGNEPVSDSGGEGHSVFADAFIKGLINMESEFFTAEQLFYRQIKERVVGNAEQTPEYNIIRNSGHNGGDFVFKKSY